MAFSALSEQKLTKIRSALVAINMRESSQAKAVDLLYPVLCHPRDAVFNEKIHNVFQFVPVVMSTHQVKYVPSARFILRIDIAIS